MYERSYGSKCTPGEYRGAADIAKDIRADIKAAKAEGTLPADLEVSVTSQSYSGGQSIDVRVRYRPEFWQVCDGTVPGTEEVQEFEGKTYVHARGCQNHWCGARNDSEHAEVHNVLTAEAQRIKKVLEGIHWSYNYDGSEIQVDYFDVNFYGHVDFEDESSAAWRVKQVAEKAQRRAEADERKALIAAIAAKTIYKPGRLRLSSTEKLRAYAAKLEVSA